MSEKVMPKAVRLIKIVSALVDNKDGLTQSQLAKMMGVHRSTIHRDLVDLTQLGPVYEDRNLIMIDEGLTVFNENKLCSFIVKAMGYRLDEKIAIEDKRGALDGTQDTGSNHGV
jgi:DNA-binding transcriptional regulator YhcF (GntR family)